MKKWTFLVASAMLVGATPVFTGCIDNDEPEGISVLRGAKAELLKAKASVEAAKVAQVQADAALTLAQAEVQKAEAARIQAIADYESAKALEMQFKAELQNIKNEEQRADLENKIKIYEEQRAAAEREAQKAAAELETSLMYWKGELAKQQAAYEIALKDLALAKTTLTQKQQDYLEPWSDALDAAKTNVDNAAKKLERKANFLAYAVRELDKAEAQKSATIQAEYQVRETKISWDAAIKAEEVAKEATTKDIAATNWDEERIKLDAQREEVRNNLLQANIKKTDIENQEATKELGAKTNELKVAYEDMAGTYYENGTVKTDSKTDFEFDPIKIESNDPALPDPVSFETNEDQQLYKYSDYVKTTMPDYYYYTLPMISWINEKISIVKSWSTTTDGKAYTAELIRDLQQDLGYATNTVDTWKAAWSNLVAIYLNSDASDYISGVDGYDAVKEKVEEYNNAAKLYNEAAAAYYDFANKRDISDQEYQDALQKNSDDKQAALADNAAKYQGKIDVIEDNLKKAETAYDTKVAVKDKCYAEYLQAPSDEKKAALDAAVTAAQEAETAYILAQTNKQDLINEAVTWKAKQDEVTNATFAVELAKLNEAYYEAHPNNAEQTQLNALYKVMSNASSTYWDVRSEVSKAYNTFMDDLGLRGCYNGVNYLKETKKIGSSEYTEYQQLEPAKALVINRTCVKNKIYTHSEMLFGHSELIKYRDSDGHYTTMQLKELTPAKIKELVTDNYMSSYPDAKYVPYADYLYWYSNFGYVGKVMAYELQIEQAQAYLDNDGKAVKDLLDQLVAAKAKVEEQIEANTATVEAAKEAYNKSQEAYDGLFTEILSEIDNAEAEVAALTAVITEIEGKITEYLSTEDVTINDKKPVTVEQFRAALELIYTNARKTTKDAEIAYQEAVEDLANINSDEKDVVAFAQKMWDDAKAKLETAQAELEAANDALQAEIERISTVE